MYGGGRARRGTSKERVREEKKNERLSQRPEVETGENEKKGDLAGFDSPEDPKCSIRKPFSKSSPIQLSTGAPSVLNSPSSWLARLVNQGEGPRGRGVRSNGRGWFVVLAGVGWLDGEEVVELSGKTLPPQ